MQIRRAAIRTPKSASSRVLKPSTYSYDGYTGIDLSQSETAAGADPVTRQTAI